MVVPYSYRVVNTLWIRTNSWINFQTHRFPSHAYRIFERDQATQTGTSTSDTTNGRSARMHQDSRCFCEKFASQLDIALEPAIFSPLFLSFSSSTTSVPHDRASTRRLLSRRADWTDYLVNSFVLPLSFFSSKNYDKIAMQLRYCKRFSNVWRSFRDRRRVFKRSPFRGWRRRLVRRPRKTDPISRIPDAEISPFVPR